MKHNHLGRLLSDISCELLSIGYSWNNKVYVLADDRGERVIGTAVNRRISQLTLDVAVHPIGCPSLGDLLPIKTESIGPADCLLCSRVGYFLPDAMDVWFSFRESDEVSVETVRNALRVAVEATNDALSLVSNEKEMFARCTPSNLIASVKTSFRGREAIVPLIRQYFEGWHPDVFRFAYYMMLLSVRTNDMLLARKYADICLKYDIHEIFRKAIKALLDA